MINIHRLELAEIPFHKRTMQLGATFTGRHLLFREWLKTSVLDARVQHQIKIIDIADQRQRFVTDLAERKNVEIYSKFTLEQAVIAKKLSHINSPRQCFIFDVFEKNNPRWFDDETNEFLLHQLLAQRIAQEGTHSGVWLHLQQPPKVDRCTLFNWINDFDYLIIHKVVHSVAWVKLFQTFFKDLFKNFKHFCEYVAELQQSNKILIVDVQKVLQPECRNVCLKWCASHPWETTKSSTKPSLLPTNIVDTSEVFELSIVLPGVLLSDISVGIKQDADLRLTLQIKDAEQPKGTIQSQSVTKEWISARGTREFHLPLLCDIDQIHCALLHGILTITIPKRPARTFNCVVEQPFKFNRGLCLKVKRKQEEYKQGKTRTTLKPSNQENRPNSQSFQVHSDTSEDYIEIPFSNTSTASAASDGSDQQDIELQDIAVFTHSQC